MNASRTHRGTDHGCGERVGVTVAPQPGRRNQDGDRHSVHLDRGEGDRNPEVREGDKVRMHAIRGPRRRQDAGACLLVADTGSEEDGSEGHDATHGRASRSQARARVHPDRSLATERSSRPMGTHLTHLESM
jgi:hypothetical protein